MARQNSTSDQPGKIVVERENGAIVVRVPVRFYRRNGRQMVLSEASAQSPTGPRPNRTLVENLAKAYRWQEQLESGEYSSFDELGKALGVDLRQSNPPAQFVGPIRR